MASIFKSLDERNFRKIKEDEQNGPKKRITVKNSLKPAALLAGAGIGAALGNWGVGLGIGIAVGPLLDRGLTAWRDRRAVQSEPIQEQ